MIGIVGGLARAMGGDDVASPLPLPAGVRFLVSEPLTAVAGRLSGMGGPAAAVTLGRTVLVAPGLVLTPRLVRHELAHVRQWERHPFTFPFRYIMAHIRHGYRNNPYEREARAAESGPGMEAEGAK